MNTVNQFLYRLLRLPRSVRMIYYIYWNRIKSYICGIHYGKNMNIYNKIYILKHNSAEISIGNNFVFTSGACFNPLSRNIRGCIYAAESAKISICDNVGISSATLWAMQEIRIGNRVKIGGDCIIMDTDAHSLDYLIRQTPELDSRNAKSSPIIIEDDVLIGTRCIILKGVTIGARTVIGSGSVVTKSIPEDCIAAGNPCHVLRSLERVQD